LESISLVALVAQLPPASIPRGSENLGFYSHGQSALEPDRPSNKLELMRPANKFLDSNVPGRIPTHAFIKSVDYLFAFLSVKGLLNLLILKNVIFFFSQKSRSPKRSLLLLICGLLVICALVATVIFGKFLISVNYFLPGIISGNITLLLCVCNLHDTRDERVA
jgi:hypothetical protein